MPVAPMHRRRSTRSRSRGLQTRALALAVAIPQRPVPVLAALFGLLTVVYLVLMITTIFYASWQTQLSKGIDDRRVAIQNLEHRYYDAIALIDATNPASVGLVAPKNVQYVAAAQLTGLTINK